MNDFIEWYLQPFKKYTEFTGRARRKEYWSFALGNFVISLILGGAGMGIGLGSEFLSLLFSLAIFIPSIAVGVRRLHDTNRSGLWLLIIFVPIVGLFVLLYFLLLDSDPATNQYGPSPKAVTV